LPLPLRLAPEEAQEASYFAASARISSFCWMSMRDEAPSDLMPYCSEGKANIVIRTFDSI